MARFHVPSGVSDAGVGLACLGQALGMMARRPRLWLLGALPPLLTSLLLFGGILGLGWGSPGIAAWATPFASGWDPMIQQIIRSLVAAMIVVAGVVLAVLLFSSLTLALGSPFYERISAAVDRELGFPPAAPARSRSAAVRQGTVDVLAGVRMSLIVTVCVLLTSLVPVVGQVAGPVLGAILGGWLVTLELMGPASERRGAGSLAARRALLRPRRAAVFGLGVPVYLAMLVPLLGVATFPVAVASGTLLVRALTADAATRGTPGSAT